MRVDGHQDFIYQEIPDVYDGQADEDFKKTKGQTSFELLKKSGLDVIFSAVFADPKLFKNSAELSWKIIEAHDKFIEKNKDTYLFTGNNYNEDKVGFLYHIEGYCNEVSDVERFYERGVRSVALTWNEDNRFAGGNFGKSDLTEEGKKLIRKIASKKMILDLAHLNTQSFSSAIKLFDKPPIVSHTACQSIAPLSKPRNITDYQIKEVSQKGGVVGIYFISKALTGIDYSDIDDVVSHIVHVVEVGGIDSVGIGSDFGGILSGVPNGLGDISKIKALETRLKEYGFNANEIGKIIGENFERVFREVLI